MTLITNIASVNIGSQDTTTEGSIKSKKMQKITLKHKFNLENELVHILVLLKNCENENSIKWFNKRNAWAGIQSVKQ